LYEISIDKAKSLITYGRADEALKIINQLKINGFATQELDLLYNMIKNKI
jgi:hypothetical protein